MQKETDKIIDDILRECCDVISKSRVSNLEIHKWPLKNHYDTRKNEPNLWRPERALPVTNK
tara:strand:+ start:311 stop:493 length:183 start_codon:yes stop_codon:yes gene_type:complete